MSQAFRAVNWNRQKWLYDATAIVALLIFLALFTGVSVTRNDTLTAETLLIRGLGLAALVLLHVILRIGPLTRLDRRFLPLLYNRRHLGVLVCLLALGHATIAVIQFHSQGDTPALVSLLTSEASLTDPGRFPFEWLGLAALAILWVMAVTSHDFWLSVLSPMTWKALHMLAYVAYALLLGHVALGIAQDGVNPAFLPLLGFGALLVFGLHIAAGVRERAGDREATDANEWVDAGPVDGLIEGRARTAMVKGERVALVKHHGAISCVSNVCRHQGGPLGEGRIVDGCLTCPWHGYQYLPENGTSPPPFTEKVATFRVRVVGDRIQVHGQANAPGTYVEPVRLARQAAPP